MDFFSDYIHRHFSWLVLSCLYVREFSLKFRAGAEPPELLRADDQGTLIIIIFGVLHFFSQCLAPGKRQRPHPPCQAGELAET
jgi:hypothetical protein